MLYFSLRTGALALFFFVALASYALVSSFSFLTFTTRLADQHQTLPIAYVKHSSHDWTHEFDKFLELKPKNAT